MERHCLVCGKVLDATAETKNVCSVCDIKKVDLMSLCRDEKDIRDCGICEYEFTDTCNLRLEEIKKEMDDDKF